MAGYASTPLERKLGIKPGDVVFLDGPPEGFALAAPITWRLPRQIRITLTFQTTPARLTTRLPALIARTEQAGMIWVCWPKKAAAALGVTSDLDESEVRRIGLAAGVVDVKVCAIDEVWSGLKFVRRLVDRTLASATARRAFPACRTVPAARHRAASPAASRPASA